MEQWNDEDFARSWAKNNTTNPARERILNLLISIIGDYLNATDVPRRILDVGCGHGVIAERSLQAFPDVTLVGLDGSPPMLAMARERLTAFATRVALIHADFETMASEQLTGGPFGIAFASQAIHNSSDEGKRRTLASVRSVMASNGLFLLYDRIKLVTPALFPVYQTVWDTSENILGNQAGEGRTFAEHTASVQDRGDQPGSLEQNMLWLREAGFGEVAAVEVIGIRALIAAVAR
jgi:tRNA (cmo5U34)-methyltransferase